MLSQMEKHKLKQPKPDYGSFQIISEKDNLIGDEEQDMATPSPTRVIRKRFPEIFASDNRLFFFRDGERRIDFVLVHEIKKSTKQEQIEKWRDKFENNLRNEGLEMERDILYTETPIWFIKLSVPWDVLIEYAEKLCFKAPLQLNPSSATSSNKNSLSILKMCCLEVPNQPFSHIKCLFKKSKMDRYAGIGNKEEFFTSVQRIRVVYEILKNATYGKMENCEFGIERLLEENVYSAAFPLHDGPYEKPEVNILPDELNKRQVLYEYWARWGRWYKYQPLEHIREYFGEKIAIYFAWLGFYTTWLLAPSIVGLLVFIYGLCTVQSDIPTNEICDQNNHYLMCPLCEETEPDCKYWNLSDTCIFSKVGYLFDQKGTVFYAVFMAFWAVLFLEYWKRKSITLAHNWDCMDFEEEEEKPRPEFSVKATCITKNPITNEEEPAFPKRIRYIRMTAGAVILLFMVALVIIFVISVTTYRLLVSVPLFQYKPFRGVAPVIASITGACINLIFIMLMGTIYEKIAIKLTDWEMHRTQTEYENNLTVKVFVFQFVNFYSSIFYIAFFKGRFAGYPGHYNKIFGMRAETCGNSGCFIELAQQLAVIMIGKQIINNVKEVVFPMLAAWWHRKKAKLDKVDAAAPLSRLHEDYKLIRNKGLFEEYLEIVLQFGFITIFVVAFPLAPLFALLNNWIEIRLDAQIFVCKTRRLVPKSAQNIGIWYKVLKFLSHLAVLSNAFLIAFTSNFLPKLLYVYQYNDQLYGFVNHSLSWAPNGTSSQPCRYMAYRDQNGNLTIFYWQLFTLRLGFVLIFEYTILGLCNIIALIIPDIPEDLEIKIKRERYFAKQALIKSEAILKLHEECE